MCDRIELHDLPESIQSEILEHAAMTDGKIETFLSWINAGIAATQFDINDQEVSGE